MSQDVKVQERPVLQQGDTKKPLMIGRFIEPIAPSNMPLSSACTWLVFGGAMCRSLCSTYPNAPREATYWEGGVTVISRLSGSCVTPERTTRTRTDSPSVYWRSGTMAGLGTGSQRTRGAKA